MPRIARHFQRDVAWCGLEAFPALEVCRLAREGRGIVVLEGAVAHRSGDAQTLARYTAVTDLGWRTGEVHIRLTTVSDQRSLSLEFDRKLRKVLVDRNDRPDLAGCIDVDLEFSPSTNTLPIRRLDLPVGASAAVRAAWVRFPSLTVEPLDQTYTRLGKRTYRYQSGTFEAELEVDDEGLVIDYPGIWRRVPAARS
jgi:hypothetical protein